MDFIMTRTAYILAPSIVLLGSIGCNDNTFSDLYGPGGGLESRPEVCVEVSPNRLSFDPVDIGVAETEPQVKTVTVSNSCQGDLEIYQLELTSQDTPFALGKLQSVFLPAGESTTFSISFAPTASGDFTDRILLDSNATDGAVAQVRAQGQGIAPSIRVTPDHFDVGAPLIGCQSTQPLTLSNRGNADLVITNIDLLTASEEEYQVDIDMFNNGHLPFRLSPYDSVQNGPEIDVFLDYVPLDTFRDDAYISIGSNDPHRREAVVTSRGTGTKYDDNLDVFEQPIRSSTDILFTLDRSGSMYDNNSNVIDNFGVFVNTLASLDADFHAAVVVDDDGCVVGPDGFIDNSYDEASAVRAFTTMADLERKLAPNVTNTERGYMLAEAALSDKNTGVGGCNAEFYRPDAFLSLVHVSDEPEQSVSSWTYYVSWFQSLKVDPEDVKINAVAGDYPSGCSGAAPGTGYYEGTVATGGLFLSICSTTWAEHLEELAAESIRVNNSFELTQLAVPQTVQVRVDGVRMNVGWAFDVSPNAVVFDTDHIPPGGSTIEIEYDRLPDCEG
ncbi:MAG: hypothetical protein ACI9MC_003194 [Kiritimatiellia bacterium]|jgi:hypothetical protein